MLTSINFFAEPLNVRVLSQNSKLSMKCQSLIQQNLEIIKYMYFAICFDQVNLLVFTETYVMT